MTGRVLLVILVVKTERLEALVYLCLPEDYCDHQQLVLRRVVVFYLRVLGVFFCILTRPISCLDYVTPRLTRLLRYLYWSPGLCSLLKHGYLLALV